MEEKEKKELEQKKKGKCVVCGRLTEDRHYFTDDGESSYLDFCCDECWEYLQERL
jgi:hypothetical protein